MPKGTIGDNVIGGEGKDQLRSLVERIERLEEEKAALQGDIKEVYGEAKANGFDTKALRKVIQLRKLDANERANQEAMIDLYMHALGMLADTPLGQAATEREFGKATTGKGGAMPKTPAAPQ